MHSSSGVFTQPSRRLLRGEMKRLMTWVEVELVLKNTCLSHTKGFELLIRTSKNIFVPISNTDSSTALMKSHLARVSSSLNLFQPVCLSNNSVSNLCRDVQHLTFKLNLLYCHKKLIPERKLDLSTHPVSASRAWLSFKCLKTPKIFP